MPRAGGETPLRVGVIGTGYMGKAHVFGYATADKVLDLPRAPVFHTLPTSPRSSRRPPPTPWASRIGRPTGGP